MLRILMRHGALAGAIGLAACDLGVANPNDPVQDQVLATPLDAEALLGRQYLRWHQGLYGSTAVFWGMAAGQAFENYSSLANNCQNQRNSIPRAVNDNSIGNGCNGEQSRVYFFHNEVNRVVSTVLSALDQPGYTMGSEARDNRARAFGQFLRGVSLGYIALFYDSSAIISPVMGTSAEDCVPDALSGICTGPLRGYKQVRDSAFAALQLAIDLANNPGSGSGGFPIPSTWLNSTPALSTSEFVRLVRSYRARIRANIPRTPAEADEVDWDEVIADAEAGFTADHQITTSTTAGLGNSWLQQWNSFGNWHQMTPFIIGMGDKSGAYQAWLAEPLAARGATGSFTMVTPDLRFPQGDTRFAQQQDFNITSCEVAATPCKRYFRNRPDGGDSNLGVSWGWSNYDFARFRSWHLRGDGGSARNGKLTFFTKAELDLLAAEGYYRNGTYATAATLINKTRTAGMVSGVAKGGGLPEVTIDPDAEVPGGTDCVPKRPVNASSAGGATLACGDMLEALKWEKRIETAYTHFAGWFLDSRRWGDLVEGTPLYWATPYTDLLARGTAASAVHSTGVNTTPGSAAGPSTYGW
jgi:hypothetical protein